MTMADSYKVTGALVLAKTPERVLYVYQGGLLPDDTDPVQVATLVRKGLVAKVEQAPVAGDETGDGKVTTADSEQLPDGAPKRAATRAEWEAYAITRGLSEEAVKAAPNKEALIDTIAAQAA